MARHVHHFAEPSLDESQFPILFKILDKFFETPTLRPETTKDAAYSVLNECAKYDRIPIRTQRETTQQAGLLQHVAQPDDLLAPCECLDERAEDPLVQLLLEQWRVRVLVILNVVDNRNVWALVVNIDSTHLLTRADRPENALLDSPVQHGHFEHPQRIRLGLLADLDRAKRGLEVR